MTTTIEILEETLPIVVNYTKNPRPLYKNVQNLSFGKTFTDHMFLMRFNLELGWHDAEIRPFGPLELSPAASGLHYGQLVWEGMKCYKTSSGEIQLFRPEMNFRRLNISAKRLCMPQINEDFIIMALKKLLSIDQKWVPSGKGNSLYIRPIMVATEPAIGVHPSSEYLFYIILSPVGPYFKSGLSPKNIYIEDKYSRAVDGGVGSSKNAGNYAASLWPATNALQNGYDQILWLDSKLHLYVEELGTMNAMFVIDDQIITPPLNGSILAGVTRDSILTLLNSHGYNVVERPISITEIIDAHKQGKLQECFGTGTACVITPVGNLSYKGVNYSLSQGKIGPITQQMYDALCNIQYGLDYDHFGWIHKIES